MSYMTVLVSVSIAGVSHHDQRVVLLGKERNYMAYTNTPIVHRMGTQIAQEPRGLS